MAALPQFDYLFAIGTIFSFLDAWNIGMSSLRQGTDLLMLFLYSFLVLCPEGISPDNIV